MWLQIWVWEVLGKHNLLNKALCVDRPLVDRRAMQSIKDMQDDPKFLNQVYAERGYGKN